MPFSIRALILRAFKQLAGAQVDATFAPLVALINGGLTEANLSPRARIPLSMRQRKQGVLALQLHGGEAGLSGTNRTFHVPAVPELLGGSPVVTYITFAGGAALDPATYEVVVNGVAQPPANVFLEPTSGFVRGIFSFGSPFAMVAGSEITIRLLHGDTVPEQDAPFVAVAWLRANHVK